MFKPVACDFYEAAVADHEFAAIQCADPMMREVWLATAAEWRIVSLTRPAPRRARKVKPAPADQRPKSSVGDVLVFASAIATAGVAVAPEFGRRELNELLAGQLILDMHGVGAEPVVALDAVDALAAAAIPVMPTLDVHDLIV